MSLNNEKESLLVDHTEGPPSLEAPSSLIEPYAPPSSGRAPTNSWFTTSFYMVAQMAGIGVLGVPAATASSGWLGIALLALTAAICMLTANMLGSIMMRMPQAAIRDYPSVGGAAFGRVGVFLTTFAQYSTLAGVSVIFMLSSGNFLHGIFCQVPARLFTILVGLVMIALLIIVPVMQEVKFFAYIGVATTFVATYFAIALALIYYLNGPCYNEASVASICHACEHDTALLTIASGFSVYSFAFGGHASIPNFFLEMKYPRHFYRTTAVVFPVSFALLYMPMAVVGYYVYGRGLDEAKGTVLDAILFFDPGQSVSIIIINVILVIHLLTAIPIILTPICLFFQRLVIKDKSKRMSRSFPMILTRVVIISVLTLIAVVFPYFIQMISIVTDISVVFSVYIFPCLFYWKLRTNSRKQGVAVATLTRIGLVLIIVYGLAGSVFGLMQAIPSLVHAVETGGNPFANIFTFGCDVTGTLSNSTAGPPINDTVCILTANHSFAAISDAFL